MMYVMVVGANETKVREYLKAHTVGEGLLVHAERCDEATNYVFRIDEDWPEEDAEMLYDFFDRPDLQNAPCVDADEFDIHP